MAMSERGLTKLMEECGELIQDAAKLIAYPGGTHPDGGKDLYLRLEDEIADVLAITHFVHKKLKLDKPTIQARFFEKLKLFESWDEDDTNGQ